MGLAPQHDPRISNSNGFRPSICCSDRRAVGRAGPASQYRQPKYVSCVFANWLVNARLGTSREARVDRVHDLLSSSKVAIDGFLLLCVWIVQLIIGGISSGTKSGEPGTCRHHICVLGMAQQMEDFGVALGA